MGGLMHRPPLCQILLLVVVVVSFVGHVSCRARIVRSVAEELTESPDDHTTTTEAPPATEADSGDRKRRSTNSHAPSAGQGTFFQAPGSGHGTHSQAPASGHGTHSQAPASGHGTGAASGANVRGNVDFYSLQPNLLSLMLSHEALEMMNTFSPTQKCGAKSPIKSRQCNTQGRIASGNEDAEGCFADWPWHVAILEKQRHKCTKPSITPYDRQRLRCDLVHPVDLYRYICGGSLITPNHVLTAAHCVKGVRQDRLKLHLGDYNLYSSSGELLPEIQRSVQDANIHEGYDPYTYEDDIAILTLDKPVDLRLTPHISPVCLPSVDLEFTENTHCSIVGWGEDPYKPNHGSNILKSVDVTIGTEEECEDKLGQSFTLGRHQLCVVGNLGTDACLGDGGGAVVCPVKSDADFGRHYRGSSNSPDKYVAVGIISWGSESCGENSVTIINMVLPYLSWIATKTSPRNQPQGYYGSQQHGGQGGGTSPCTHNPFFQKAQTGGLGAIIGQRMLLHDIVCVFGAGYTEHPNYRQWYDSVFGPAAGTGVHTSPATDVHTSPAVIGVHTSPATGIHTSPAGTGVHTSPATGGSCDENKFFKKVQINGYTVIAKTQLSLEDIKCVFGEDFTKNPLYGVWFDSVHGESTSPVVTDKPDLGTLPVVPSDGCEQNPFLQKVETGGYGAIAGMSLQLEDLKCVFGEEFERNPNYAVWYETVHGTDVTPTTPPSTDDSCRGNTFFGQVLAHGYEVITGTLMSIEDIKCVFGVEFTKHPHYLQWFVSVFCTPGSLKQYPTVCCEPEHFSSEVCCGAGKHNPAGLCGGGQPGY